ncbi:MAG: NAD+ synthase [Spirochaetaceae bacterium]|jgi:NAD+ synthase (glutamine-hydrolysing)|nr:NAD+ synthase [Spirochaetaceae bacterium]
MRISAAQINSTIGDFSGNREKILAFSQKARDKEGADLVLFPELSICGYPPMDLLDQDCFVEQNIRTLRILQRQLPAGIAVGVGYVSRSKLPKGKSLVNAFGIILDGELVFEQVKTLLPTYDVFDEARNFEPASQWPCFSYKGERIGVAICEDVWRETETPGTKYAEDPVRRLLDRGISLLAVPSASPYYAGKHRARLELSERIVREGDVPIIYINAVGANDSIIFDGRAFFMNTNMDVKTAASFAEDIITVDFDKERRPEGRRGKPARPNKERDEERGPSLTAPRLFLASHTAPAPHTVSVPHAAPLLHTSPANEGGIPAGNTGIGRELDTLEDALVMGIREYMNKCGFSRAHLGLSGGIDSALVAYLAVKAAGKDNVVTISMPSRFSSQGSRDDAAELAANLGCRYETLPIEPVFSAFLTSLAGLFENRPFDIAEENLQARIRGSLLMAFSNKWQSMLLTTGNKSELAMGYCTLYGDMDGALAPIGDMFKTEVFTLCRRINEKTTAERGKPVIPEEIIKKPPSAELRPNQKDEDSLPPYDELDEILKLYLFNNLSADEIGRLGKNRELAASIITTVARAEFKRRQAPPVLKVSPRAFGMGRRMPIARAVYESSCLQD